MTDKDILATSIVRNGWYKKGKFTLSSGRESDYYIDLRPCMLSSSRLHLVTTCLIQILSHEVQMTRGNLLCGVITSGLFLAGAMLQRLSPAALETNAVYCRTEHRTHGIKRNIEGVFYVGQEVILLDDVATSGASLFEVKHLLQNEGLKVKAAVVVVDRQEGAREALAATDVPLFSVLTIDDIRRFDL